MQSSVQNNVDSTSRYSSDVPSSHSANGGIGSSFLPNYSGNMYRNVGSNGTHSNNNLQLLSSGANSEVNGSHSQSLPYGAQYNSSGRAKTQGAGCETSNSSSINSPYSGWQGLNTSASSVSSNNGWIVQNSGGGSSSQKNIDAVTGSKDNTGKEGEENMVIDGDMSFSDLIGATGVADNADEKQTSSNNDPSNVSWGMSSHMALINSTMAGWNPSQNSMTGTSVWETSQDMSGNSDSTENNADMMVDNQSRFSGLIGATGGSDFPENKQHGNNSNNYKQDSAHQSTPRLGLLGGGESSLNVSTSGWGAPAQTGGNGSGGWVGGNVPNSDVPGGNGMSPPKTHGSWAQAAGKGLNPGAVSSSNNTGPGNAVSGTDPRCSTSDAPPPPPVLTKAQEEASELRMMAAKSEGWGQSSVNQESQWQVAHSPPPADSKEGQPPPPVWRTTVNNGTEIWENNLRMNKGAQPPPAVPAGPPWGQHTPTTNIGGHWGDDDSSNNTWNNAPPPPQGNMGNAANWPEQNPSGQNAMWGNTNPPPMQEKNWPCNRPPPPPWNDNGSGMPLPENNASVWNPPMAKQQRNVGNWSPGATPKKEGQPSGWEIPSPPVNRRSLTDDGTAVWGNPQQQGKVSHWKEMPPTAKGNMNSGNGMHNQGMNAMPGGMPSAGPGMIRLPTGASVGGKSEIWNKPAPNRTGGWQEMPPHDGPTIGTWGEEPPHMNNPMKNMSGPGNANFGGEWVDQNNPMTGYWGAKPRGPPNWADGQVDTSSWLGPTKQGGKPLTRDLIWASKQFRLLLEMNFKKDDVENALRNNNMNYNDALVELRASQCVENNMEVDGYHGRKVRSANMSEDVSMSDNMLDPSYNSGNYHGSGGFQGSGNFQGMGAFKQVKVPGPNNSPIINATLGGQQSNLGSVGNFSPVLFQKILQQQQNPMQFSNNMQQLNNQANRISQNNFPSTSQLRHLVQQIQMAVQAGHLNPQILNQPLAPQTLQLLYQLLQQIKMLATLNHQQMAHGQHPKSGGPGNYQISQTKQRILTLQSQISSHQAHFLKQQVPPQQSQPNQGLHVPQNPTTESFKQNFEQAPALHNNFGDLTIKDVRDPIKDQSFQAPGQQQQQSRFANVWKSCYDKDENSMGNNVSQNTGGANSFVNDFSRAPGPLPSKASSSSSSAMQNSGPNLHPLLGQGDSAWSSLPRPQGESGWPDTATSLTGLIDNASNNPSSLGGSQMPLDAKEPSSSPPSSGPSTTSASHSSYNLTDLVPEFEPGKPWKGNQLKNIEDDPHITPGSIVRSPLSVNTIKDADLFWNSKPNPSTTSGTDPPGSLASSTWIFTPSNSAASNSPTEAINKPVGGKTNWSSATPDSTAGTDVWSSSLSKSRGPPPGLSAQGWDQQNSSMFLLLRNLTPQIDGSTLKTLCMQHGPLSLFHLNHGSAIARYNSREEAAKAQSALNNCVLANTTIMANIPTEAEIQQYMGQFTNQNVSSNGTWPTSQQHTATTSNSSGFRGANSGGSSSYSYSSSSGSGGGGGSSNGAIKQDPSGWNGNNLNMPSQLWSYPNASGNLWGSSQAIGDHESSTNSSLNRFLPDNLLGGESM